MIGTTVSHYEVLERLGGGGMGVVYKARDTKLGRFAALKFLSAHRGGGAAARRFLREARAASVLDHPNICTLYEIGETAEGVPFLAMAFCEGETLARRLAQGPLSIRQALDLASQIAAGLAAAHEKGVVHRDVKPANVIVSPEGRVKIVDFGIAQLAGESRITREGGTVGTAAYMAPEQLLGEGVDARADAWALGAVLYEMVAGRPPFSEATEQETVRAILSRPPEPLGSLRSGVPPALERVVVRALAKSPAERYQHIAEMHTDLRRAGEDAESSEGLGATLTGLAAQSGLADPTGPGLTGHTVGPYRILARIGGGGMGVVYKAEDLRLARTVALKFLPPDLTRDPAAKARFLQEARAASSLDHPNLCTVHEVGETADGLLYLAMPCYEGETVRQKIERGPLSVDEVTDIALQTARGLAKAHKNGIVHRDIKPANLFVTLDGVVKILDFGLAKLTGAAAITKTGLSVGTPAYMSPEQACGELVDHRSDLWSLGVVLYEMLAGERPFRGDHDQDVLQAILHDKPPPVGRLRPDVPPDLETIVAGLLIKDPDDRYLAAEEPLKDLQILRNQAMTGTLRTQQESEDRQGRLRGRVWTALAAAALAAGLAAYLLARSGRAAPVPASFSRLTDLEGTEAFPSLSPAGDFFVYARTSNAESAEGTEGTEADIYWQRTGGGSQSNPVNLTSGSPAADTQPAVSPDGQQIAFRSERDGGGIFLMGATGESVRRLTDFGFNPAWSPDGREIVVATEGVADPGVRRSSSQLWRIEVATGRRRAISTAGDAVQPSWSPGNKRIAYWGIPAGTAQRVLWTVPAAGGEPVPAVADAHLNWSPAWSPDGRFLYFASDRSGIMNLWRVAIDEDTGKVRGEPQAVTTSSQAVAWPSLSQDGLRLLYATADRRSNVERIDPAGGLQPVTRGSRAVRSAQASPDGRWIAFDEALPQEDLFVVRPDGTELRQLTQDAFKDRFPRWSPDGTRILFYSNRSGRYEAWTVRPDGSGLEQLTATQGEPLFDPVWSPDGRRLAVTAGFTGTALIDLTRPPAGRTPRPLPPVPRLGSAGQEAFGARAWSHDGTRLLGDFFRVDEKVASGFGLHLLGSGRYEKLADRGRGAAWLPGDREVLFLDGGRVLALDLGTRAVREVLAPSPGSAFLGVSPGPDGRTLYAVRGVDEGDAWLLTLE